MLEAGKINEFVEETTPSPDIVPSIRITLSVLRDEPIARFALAGLLRTQSDFSVLSEFAADANSTNIGSNPTEPVILIADLSSTSRSALDVVGQVRTRYPTMPVILLSHNDHSWSLVDALRLGVRGCLYKTASPDALFEAIRVVHSGRTYLDPSVHAAVATAVSDDEAPMRCNLTRRERRILQLVAQGQTNAQIGAAVFLSQSTVKYHLNSVYRKLSVNNRAAAARFAVELGILAPS